MTATEFDSGLLGAIPSPPDIRDFLLPLDEAVPLEAAYAVPGMPPVLNQNIRPKGEPLGTCVAYSSTAVRLWQERQDGHGWLPFDPYWLYHKAQAVDGIPVAHEGTTLRAAMRVMAGSGLALKGHPEAAPSFRIARYYAIPLSTDSLKRAILAYGPINVASRWFEEWMRPMGGVLAAPRNFVGGHGTVLFGWDDARGFLLRNSWGRTWGTGYGNAWAPYRYFVPELHDAWKSADITGD